ncbi:hypothetical protein [Rubeoparvulum massiliense]|uniref:hypothetical protein n=1 Tax=Rubeoparvulum massiliense TaxID=1631346 RepID=UPI00065DCB0F|nr:hypothetical protein [Rubeoparvulum massiliense]
MSILDGLASVCGEKPKAANKAVAMQCIANPSHIAEIADHIGNQNHKIGADCAEVMTMIAEEQPELISSYAPTLLDHLKHKKSNVRWECAHALALTAHTIGDLLLGKLDDFLRIIENDDSIVVRDYITDILTNLAKIGEAEAKAVYPYLTQALVAHNRRHAGHAIDGLIHIASITDSFDADIIRLIEPSLMAEKKAVAGKANKLIKLIEKKNK